jgi:hypothetical protein
MQAAPKRSRRICLACGRGVHRNKLAVEDELSVMLGLSQPIRGS